MSINNIKIGCGMLSNSILAGFLNKKGNQWRSKTDITDQVYLAVTEHVFDLPERKLTYTNFKKDQKLRTTITVELIDTAENEHN